MSSHPGFEPGAKVLLKNVKTKWFDGKIMTITKVKPWGCTGEVPCKMEDPIMKMLVDEKGELLPMSELNRGFLIAPFRATWDEMDLIDKKK